MRPSTAKHSGSCRRRGKASITIFTALFALAGGAQALAPVPAAAMIDQQIGTCELGWNYTTNEPCALTAGEGGGSPAPPSGEVIEVTGQDPICPVDDPDSCLPQPDSDGAISGSDLFGQAPARGSGGSLGKAKRPQEKETAMLKECRQLLGQYQHWQMRWEGVAYTWVEFAAELTAIGIDPNNPYPNGFDPNNPTHVEIRDEVQRLEKRLRELTNRIKLGILDWLIDDCGPVPLKWKVLHGLAARGLRG